jgi:hypothetical protein
MSFAELAKDAAKEIVGVLEASPNEEQISRVKKAIERVVIEAVLEEQRRCAHAAIECCSADKDMAHKIGEEIRRSEVGLIANLSALR